jgi:hypothetical protein
VVGAIDTPRHCFSQRNVQEKAVAKHAVRARRTKLSRNLFPIAFSRNCLSDMEKENPADDANGGFRDGTPIY